MNSSSRIPAAGPLSYRQAGVDIEAADHFARSLRALAARTHGPDVVPTGDAYGALFRPPLAGLDSPLLAATCDGVGTKLLVARACGDYRGLGQDLVAMNVNDLLPRGARPLFFLDYIAVGRLADLEARDGRPGALSDVAQGMVAACAQVGCALIGGETAEMPDLYRPGDFDLAGFAVGLVDAARVPAGDVAAGDVVLGLAANGVHANGFSLIRRVLSDAGIEYGQPLPGMQSPIGAMLLQPTALYVAPVLALMSQVRVKAAAHVTGGGILRRARGLVPDGLRVELDPTAFARPPIFDVLAALGRITDTEMACTFNMGLGFLVVVDADAAAQVVAQGAAVGADEPSRWLQVGRIVRGPRGAVLGHAAV